MIFVIEAERAMRCEERGVFAHWVVRFFVGRDLMVVYTPARHQWLDARQILNAASVVRRQA